MKMMTFIAIALMSCVLAVVMFSMIEGGLLISVKPSIIPSPPGNLDAAKVIIPVPGTFDIHGWWVQGQPGKATVLLLHGVRANRLAMVGRVEMLKKHGYSVLLVDLPCHGESNGEKITFGLKESAAVDACRIWISQKNPGGKAGVIGVSLGGASILLGKMPCGFDAVVLEAVYSNIHRAIENRLRVRFGRLAPLLTPLLESQIRFRLDVNPVMLNPSDRISQLGSPVLVMAGEKDRHTQPEEALSMYDKAAEPKSFLLVPGAAHSDFHTLDPEQYESHVIPFFSRYL